MSRSTYHDRFASRTRTCHLRTTRVSSHPRYRPLRFEPLEDRRLLSVTWLEQGPGPILNGQCVADPDNLVVGAVEALAADPTNSNVVYAGTVAGGVWKTTNFLQVGGQPTWVPLTDQYASLAIGALAMSPLDASHNTLFAGTAEYFISGGPNGRAVGILRTTNGGTSWDHLAQATFAGRDIRSVVPTTIGTDLQHQVVLVAAEGNGGVYRSTDGGSTFTRLSGTSGEGDGLDNDADGSTDEVGELNLPFGNASHLVGDPGSSTRFFAAIPGQGIFRSTDGGQQWTKVSNPIPNMAATTRIELSVSAATGNTVYAALLDSPAGPGTGRLRAVYYSINQGTNWTALGTVPEATPGDQGDDHFSILADPTHPNLVYIGGDRRTVEPWVGSLHRGDTTTGSWTPLSRWDNTDDTAPHADSRDMIFISTGIAEADDGGIYHLSDPAGAESIWTAKSGNLRVTEFYSVAYDNLSNRIIGGTQDTGVAQQASPGSFVWDEYTQGDGGTVDVGYFTISDDWYSIRYSMGNNFGTFRRQVFDADGDDNNIGDFIYGGQADLNGLNGIDAGFGGFSVFPFQLNRSAPWQVAIGGNALYESGDWADNLTILNTGGLTGVTALAYGGMLAGAPNANVLYAGFAGALLLRSTAGTMLSATNYANPQRGTPRDIVLDPDDWQRVYVTDGTRVHRSTDAGATWTTIGSVQAGGNLAGLTDELYSIELYSPTTLPGDEVVLVGGRNGVFRTFDPDRGATSAWFELGWNLPNVPVSDLRYDATDDVLLTGTHGRGAWTLPQASQAFSYDLRGYGVDVPDKIDWGETFILSGRVINEGNAPLTKNFTQRFYLSDDLTFSETDYYLGAYTHTAVIEPGGTGPTFTVNLTMPTEAQAGFSGTGPFYIGMWTDRDQDIAETNEANNLPPASGLHLDYDSFTIPPSADLRGWRALVQTTINWGETFTVLGQVHNSGTLPVTTDFRQQFFLAPDDIWGDGDEIYLGNYLHTADVPGPGVGPTFLATLTLPSTTPPGFSGTGPFYIGMTTDALNNVAEKDETNNFPGSLGSLGLGYDYDSFNVPETYDLRGWYTYVPSTIGWGEAFTLQGRVRNDGTLPVTTDFRQQFFLGADQIWGNGEEQFLYQYIHTDDVPANGLGPAFEVTLTLPSTPPPGFTGTGPFYIGMTTDAQSNIAETNEANNFPGSFGLGYDYDSFSVLTNDYFAYRIDLGSASSVTDTASNSGYSAESGEPAQSGDIHSAWWSWTAPADGALTADTFGSNFDTFLTLASGSAVNALSVLAQNDDSGGGLQSRIADWSVTAGTQYQIAVDGYQAATGNITLSLSFTNNDDFAYRIDLSSASPVTDSGGNGGYTGETDEPPQSGPINSAWWSWTAPSDGILTVDTFGSNFDTYLSLATGSAVNALSVVAQNDDSGGTLQSRLSEIVTVGTQYQIAVDGYQANTGHITLNLFFTNNDNFVDRIDLGSVTSITDTGSNGGYSGETDEPPQSGPLNSAWWTWTSPSDGTLTIDTFGSNFDTYLTLATGSAVNALSVVAQNDDSGGTLQSRLSEIVTTGMQYQIAVDGYQASTGNITLNLSFIAGVPNLTPHQPAGWTDTIVVSKQAGTSADDSPLYSTDTLYVDWSAINGGTAETGLACSTELYLDGVLRDVFNMPTLNPGSDYRVYDYILGNLSAGTHTLRIVADSTGLVQESNEADNQYERTFIVEQGRGAIRVVKDAVPEDPHDFRFTGSLGAFLLDDDPDPALSNRRVFSELAPGTYVIAEDAMADWWLSSLVIAGDLDNGSTIDLANRTVTLDLDPGENLSVTFVNERLAGDYNLNGLVDAADYVVWRDTLGASVTPYFGADGSGNGSIDQGDYDVWKAHFGNTLPLPGAGAAAGLAANVVQPPALPANNAAMPLANEPTVPTTVVARSPDRATYTNRRTDDPVRPLGDPTDMTDKIVRPTNGQVRGQQTRAQQARNTAIAAVPRDDLLLAWLSLADDDNRPDEDVAFVADRNDSVESLADARDRLFGLIGNEEEELLML